MPSPPALRRTDTKNHADAFDLAQQTLVVLHSREKEFDTDLPLAPWVLGHAKFVLLAHVKKSAIRHRILAELQEAGHLKNGDLAEDSLNAVWEAEYNQLLYERAEQLLFESKMLPQTITAGLMKMRGINIDVVAATLGMSDTEVHRASHRVGNFLQRNRERIEACG